MINDPFYNVNPHINLAKYDVVATPWIMRERVIFDYELMYVKDGKMRITVEDQCFDSKPGEIYLFRPGQRHSISALEGDYVIQPHVHFDLMQYEDQSDYYISYKNLDQMTAEERAHIHPDIMAELFPNFPSRLVLNTPQRAEILLFDVIQSYVNRSAGMGQLEMKGAFLRFFTYLLKEVNYIAGLGKYDEKRELAAQIRDFLENNLRRSVRMEEVSELFHMDSSYLGHIFREEYKISPIKYHSMLRIKKSREMLIYTNASITGIAQRMGFESLGDFSRAFKRVEGISPNQVRNNHGESAAIQETSENC